MQNLSDNIDLKQIIKRKGEIYCPHPDCVKQNISFSHETVATNCNPKIMKMYINTYSYAMQQNETMDKIQSFIKSVSDKLPEFDRENRRLNMKRACPNSRMCRKCNYGPMELSHCIDLQTHAHQYKNSCPRCGDHAKLWTDLPIWDGRLAEESNKYELENPKKDLNKIVSNPICMCLYISYPVNGWVVLTEDTNRIITLQINNSNNKKSRFNKSAFMLISLPNELIPIIKAPPITPKMKTLELKGTIKVELLLNVLVNYVFVILYYNHILEMIPQVDHGLVVGVIQMVEQYV